MRRLVPAVKAVTEARRVYFLSVNEHARISIFGFCPRRRTQGWSRFLSL
jgi:hypothetical protein